MIQAIRNKTRRFFRFTVYTFLPLIGGGWVGVACSDWFDIKPQTELVSDDFWQSKSDVESAVAACYRAMMEPDVMERLIAWGEVRSDNVQRGQSPNDDMSYMLTANIDASNSYAKWSPLYRVINYCNTVLENAQSVQQRDPNFKVSELRAYEAEAKTLRALCYYYLVRTFRDVPFTTEAYSDDVRPFQLAQTDGNEILKQLLAELETISENSAKSVYSTTADTKGRITQKALWTLMADMYLWLNDYDKCIALCEKVLSTATNPLHLESPSTYNRQVFGLGNSSESIFELEFDAQTPNYIVNEMYGYGSGRTSANYLSAADFTMYTPNPFSGSSDQRRYDAFYNPSSGSSSMIPIKKFIAYRQTNSGSQVRLSDYQNNDQVQHWIFYRLPDVYLMMAEALTERNDADDLARALVMVSHTYERANSQTGSGTLSSSEYASQEKMRDLVFEERQREFVFEGKRYFDILRRCRREGFAKNVTYLTRKYVSEDKSTIESRLSTLDALYMPIHQDELKLNRLLKQNPFYATSDDIERN